MCGLWWTLTVAAPSMAASCGVRSAEAVVSPPLRSVFPHLHARTCHTGAATHSRPRGVPLPTGLMRALDSGRDPSESEVRQVMEMVDDNKVRSTRTSGRKTRTRVQRARVGERHVRARAAPVTTTRGHVTTPCAHVLVCADMC